MLVRDIMSAPVITIHPRATIRSAIQHMLASRLSGLPVAERPGALLGIVSEGDLLHRAEIGTAKTRSGWLDFLLGPGRSAQDYTQAHARYVEDVMTRDVVTIDENATLDDAVKLMEQHKIKRLPVTRDGALIGIMSRADVMRALLQSKDAQAANARALDDPAIKKAILDEINAQRWSTPDSIKVEVNNGDVVLSGVIFDERERDAVRVCAENVPGVKTVIDNMIWIDPESGTYLGPPGTGGGGI
jgi:CBS domain-containing protein